MQPSGFLIQSMTFPNLKERIASINRSEKTSQDNQEYAIFDQLINTKWIINAVLERRTFFVLRHSHQTGLGNK